MKRLLRELYKNDVNMNIKKNDDSSGFAIKFKKNGKTCTYNYYSKEFYYESENEVESALMDYLQMFLKKF